MRVVRSPDGPAVEVQGERRVEPGGARPARDDPSSGLYSLFYAAVALKPRRLSLKSNERNIGKLRGPNGKRLCRWCGKEVLPPRRTFCSDLCTHEWRVRSSTSYLRERVYARDRGVCAKCERDTRKMRMRLEDEQTAAMARCGVFGPTPTAEWRADPGYLAFLRKPPFPLTVKEADRSLWQADHRLEVADGGGLCGLDGLRTLCLWCHKDATKIFMQLKRKNAKTGIEIKPPKVPGAPKGDIDRDFE